MESGFFGMQEYAHLHGHIRCNFPEFFFQEMFVIDDKSIKLSRVEQEEFFGCIAAFAE